jgi:hypothetical protein
VARSWASIFREGALENLLPPHTPTAKKDDYIALYECCVATRLQIHVAISHAVERQGITITC